MQHENIKGTNDLIRAFVEKMSKPSIDKYGVARSRTYVIVSHFIHSMYDLLVNEYFTRHFSLWVLFQSVDKANPIRYHIYYNLVIIAQSVDIIRLTFKDVKQLKEQFASLSLTDEEMQKLLRSLHDALVRWKHR